jgi:diguanylate cyclase (GGDEF)-like protein
MSETPVSNPNSIKPNLGFSQPGIQLHALGGDGNPIGQPGGATSPEIVARRLTRFLSLVDLFQTMNHYVKLPEILTALSQNLVSLFRFQAFAILWTDGDRLQVNLYPVVPVNQTFVEDTIAVLLQTYAVAQALSPNVQIADPANPAGPCPAIPSGTQEAYRSATPTEPAATKVADTATSATVNSHLTVPLITSGKAVGAVTLCNMYEAAYSDEDAQIFSVLGGYLAATLENAMLFQRVEALAASDGLTQLCNHAHFYEMMDTEIIRAHRYAYPLSLILLDVDDFKAVNDTYGHQMGDAVLREVAAIIRSVVRQVDIAARYGGDEFAILTPQTDWAGAVALAARLQHRVADHLFAIGATSIHITLSLGVSSLSEQIKFKESLVGEADIALYRAKQERKRKASERPRPERGSAFEGQMAFSYAT